MDASSQRISSDALAAAIGTDASQELSEALKKLRHCVNQLSNEQVWWRESESQNSIGNLILHLCGNVRQWIVSGVGGADDVRNRSNEFSERTSIDKEELLGRLNEVVQSAVMSCRK